MIDMKSPVTSMKLRIMSWEAITLLRMTSRAETDGVSSQGSISNLESRSNV